MVNGALTVVKAPLNITIDNLSRLVNTPNPLFTAKFDGLRNGDTTAMIDIYFTTTATINSPAGKDMIDIAKYPIWSVVGANPGMDNNKAANYALNVKDGVLIVSSFATGGPDLSTMIKPSNTTTGPSIFHQMTPEEQKKFDDDIEAALLAEKKSKEIVLGKSLWELSAANPFGKYPGAFKEMEKAVQQFIDAAARAGKMVDETEVLAALNDQDQRDAMLGALLPFLYQNLSGLLAMDESEWTPEQGVLVSAMQDYIQKQRQAAAEKGQAQYAAWQAKQQKKRADKFEKWSKLCGVCAIKIDTDDSTTPELPPEEFLDQMYAGMTMTEDQLVTYAQLTNKVAEMGEQMKAYQSGEASAADKTPDNLAGAIADAGKLLFVTNTLAGNTVSSTTLVSKVPAMGKIFPNAARAISRLNAKAALGLLEEGAEVAKTLTKVAKITKMVKGVGKVLGPLGLATELVGNAVELWVGVGLYTSIAMYDKEITQASNAAQQKVTTSDLKAMMNSGAAFSYLTMMAATKGDVTPTYN